MGNELLNAFIQPITGNLPIIIAVASAIFGLRAILIAMRYSRKAAGLAKEYEDRQDEVAERRQEIRMRIDEARARLLEIQVKKAEKELKSEDGLDDFSDCPVSANDADNLEDEENELQAEIDDAETALNNEEFDDWRC
ncbi:MAG: hypothetical protein IKZ88_08685 [Neisseriaceae bacterium]|nr:hypothetical protein [Neisseriaceae bacterium]